MPDGNLRGLKALRKLGHRVQQGLPMLHPVAELHLEKVRQGVRQAQRQGPDNDRRALKALRQLGHRMHQGLPLVHPVDERHLIKVREPVRRQ